MSTLAHFLASNKSRFLSSIKEGASNAWTVVMGNEAGDLDSLASSIAFSYLRSSDEEPTIAYIPYDPNDLNLRAENLHALQLAGIDPKDLLFAPDVSYLIPASKFALVDHNRLGSIYTGQVVAVIDHHEDEGCHTDAPLRIVAPAGSCASHVTKALFKPDVPPQLATLLLSAVVIDTAGLKPGGKALDVDREAAATLLPASTLPSSLGSSPFAQLLAELAEKKANVAHLPPRDLLRRDYKEYGYSPAWISEIKAGLSTVPTRLQAWGSDGKLEETAVAWMTERNLHVLGVLTSYDDPDELNDKGKPKHKRQMAWFVNAGPSTEQIANRIWSGIESSTELRAEVNNMRLRALPEGMAGKVYKQKNANATRKAVAPLLKRLLEAD